MYGSSALKMFKRNGAIAQKISSGARVVESGLQNLAGSPGRSSIGSRVYRRGAQAAKYVADNPRRATGGAALGLGAMGLAGNGRRNNSPYSEPNPYSY